MLLNKLKLVKLDEIDSTNDYLKRNYKDLTSLTIVKTNFQTKGKGQFERTWISNKDENLLFSMLIKDVPLTNLEFIKLVTKESLIMFLKHYNIEGIFKEPNDILVNSKKILGILIETEVNGFTNNYNYVVIGIGININQTEFNDLFATSLKNELNKDFNPDKLLKEFIDFFLNNYNEKMKLFIKNN